VVPLNTRHAPPELEYALRDSGARVLLTDRDLTPFGGLVERVVTLGAGYESLLAAAAPAPLGDDTVEDDLAGLFYTGGTTGLAKVVMLSHRNLIANTFHWMASVPYTGAVLFLVLAPLFHAAGSNGVLAAVWTGATQVTLPAFYPGEALGLIERHAVTATLGVPTMLAALAEERRLHPRETASLRWIAHGGSPMASEVIRRTHAAFPGAELVEVYGATELSPLATVQRGEQVLANLPRRRSCGQAIPGVELRILGRGATRGPEARSARWWCGART
jgi:long-chain acyl-CoA synthetase